MIDSNSSLGTGAFGPEPARDQELGAALRGYTGGTPFDAVNWARLAERISDRVNASPWWAYATQWERRLIPIAIAAGLAGALALWNTSAPLRTAALPDGLAIVLDGTPSVTAARQYARELTSGVDITDVGVPE